MINPVQAANREATWRAAGLEGAQHADVQKTAGQLNALPDNLYDVIRAGFGSVNTQLDQRYPTYLPALQAAIAEDDLAPLLQLLERAEGGLVSDLSVGGQLDVFRAMVEQASPPELERLYLQLPEAQQRSRFGEVLAAFGSYDTRQTFLTDMEAVLTAVPNPGDADVLNLLSRSLALHGAARD